LVPSLEGRLKKKKERERQLLSVRWTAEQFHILMHFSQRSLQTKRRFIEQIGVLLIHSHRSILERQSILPTANLFYFTFYLFSSILRHRLLSLPAHQHISRHHPKLRLLFSHTHPPHCIQLHFSFDLLTKSFFFLFFISLFCQFPFYPFTGPSGRDWTLPDTMGRISALPLEYEFAPSAAASPGTIRDGSRCAQNALCTRTLVHACAMLMLKA
jgi:hypothetical protein